jgi:type I restriction enzyme, R subunit
LEIVIEEPAPEDSDRDRHSVETGVHIKMKHLLLDHTELFEQFSDNPLLRKWLGSTIFDAAYGQ